MSKYIYPAIFEKEDSGLYSVSFPDLENVYTGGKDLDDALKNAEDVLNLMLYDKEVDGELISPASNPLDLTVPMNSFVTLVQADTMQYRKQFNSKSVKKTLTIPEWLNEMSEKENINFSQTLQEALKEKLGL